MVPPRVEGKLDPVIPPQVDVGDKDDEGKLDRVILQSAVGGVKLEKWPLDADLSIRID